MTKLVISRLTVEIGTLKDLDDSVIDEILDEFYDIDIPKLIESTIKQAIGTKNWALSDKGLFVSAIEE